MNFRSIFKLLAGIVTGCFCIFFAATAQDAGAPAPSIIDRGFQMWAKQQNASYGIDTWKKGGLLEDDNKPIQLANYFSRLDRALGNYKSYDTISVKKINQSSQIIYLSINFERASVYARFLVYRPNKEWLVQNMDFSTRPEALMPWLAFENVSYNQ